MSPILGFLLGALLARTGAATEFPHDATALCIGDAAALMQREVSAHLREDSCSDHNTPELCKKATDWGLCKGWLHGTCLSLKASCHDLRSATQCHQAKEILGHACRGWGGSSCLSMQESCADVTDETACAFGKANLGLQCKGWDGRRCLPLRAPENDEAVAARARLREEVKARSRLRLQAKEEARALAEKQERRAAAAERRKLEEAHRLQEIDEEQRLAAREAIRQRRQARVAAAQAQEEARQRQEEEARRSQEEEDRRRAEEAARLAAEQRAEEEAVRKRVEADEAQRRALEEQARRVKFGEELSLRVAEGAREVDIKMRKSMKMRVLMNAARNRLALPDGTARFTFRGKEVDANATPLMLGLTDGALITVATGA